MPTNFIPNEVKLFPDPAKAAIKAGDERVFRLWTLCRDIMAGQGGSSWLSGDDVRSALAAIGLARTSWYHIQKHPAFRVYFSQDPNADRVFLTGLEKVCIHYNCVPRQTPVYVPLKDLHRIKTFRAHIHAAQFDQDGFHAGRAKMQKESGISPASQRRYEDIADVTVTPTFVYAYADEQDELPIPEQMAEAKGWEFFTRLPSGEIVIRWQQANHYCNENRNNAPRGMSQKITKRLNALVFLDDEKKPKQYFVYNLKHQTRSCTPLAIKASPKDLQRIGLPSFGGIVFQHFYLP